VAPQDSQNFRSKFCKAQTIGRRVCEKYYGYYRLFDTVINTLLGGLTLDPAGMHCPAWDDAFVSSFITNYKLCNFK